MLKDVKSLLSQVILLENDNFTANIWGGHWIPRWKGVKRRLRGPCGESWEFSGHKDHPNQVIIPGGKRVPISDFVDNYPKEILGKKALEKFGRGIPFLLKVIDAHETLSIQVHPDERYARLHETDPGKFESWVVIDSAKGPGFGKVYLGLNQNKAGGYAGSAKFKEAFFQAVHAANRLGPTKNRATLRKAERLVLPFLNEIKVSKGDIFELPPGTIHAIGRGVRIFEIQKPSNITYRIWDWNRPNSRPLHLAKAKDVVNFSKLGLSHLRHGRISRRLISGGKIIKDVLIRNRKAGYGTDQIVLKGLGTKHRLNTRGQFFVLTVITGEVQLSKLGKDEAINPKVKIGAGQTVLIPASLPGVIVKGVSRASQIFRSYPY